MANKAVEFEDEAEKEVEAAHNWYLERSETAAGNFLEELDRAVKSIAVAPSRWPRGPSGTRRLLLRHFPFVLFYRELPRVIKVVAVAHGYRHPDYWKYRL